MNKLRTSKILLLANEIEKKRKEILKTYKLSLGQEIFLNALLEKKGMTMGMIGEIINTAAPSTTKYATKLENLGFITRQPSKLDSRHHKANLTESGIETIKEINQAYEVIDTKFHKALKTKDTDRLERLLWKLTIKSDGKSDSKKKPKKAGKNKDLKKSKEKKKKEKNKS
ncbi:MAG: MarR family transcriptional regulator [Rhizobiales bacterium]|nr:MarR family transcriptional regulator [Hyphomicrobiales bacterium]